MSPYLYLYALLTFAAVQFSNADISVQIVKHFPCSSSRGELLSEICCLGRCAPGTLGFCTDRLTFSVYHFREAFSVLTENGTTQKKLIVLSVKQQGITRPVVRGEIGYLCKLFRSQSWRSEDKVSQLQRDVHCDAGPGRWPAVLPHDGRPG